MVKTSQPELLLVKVQSNDDNYEGCTEVRIELESKDENRERRCDQHGACDEEETCNVAAMFDNRRHDETGHCLKQMEMFDHSAVRHGMYNVSHVR